MKVRLGPNGPLVDLSQEAAERRNQQIVEEICNKLVEYQLPVNSQFIVAARNLAEYWVWNFLRDDYEWNRQLPERRRNINRLARAWTELEAAYDNLGPFFQRYISERVQDSGQGEAWNSAAEAMENAIGGLQRMQDDLEEAAGPRPRAAPKKPETDSILAMGSNLMRLGGRRRRVACWLSWYLKRFANIERSTQTIEQALRNAQLN